MVLCTNRPRGKNTKTSILVESDANFLSFFRNSALDNSHSNVKLLQEEQMRGEWDKKSHAHAVENGPPEEQKHGQMLAPQRSDNHRPRDALPLSPAELSEPHVGELDNPSLVEQHYDSSK